MTRVAVNARYLHRPVTGVERFAIEVERRLGRIGDITLDRIAPAAPMGGLKGHAWEQFALPRRLHPDALLFSPCNTGPLAVSRQLVVIHDAAVWDFPEGFSASFRRLYQCLLPRLARRASLVGTVSEYSRKRLAPLLGLPEERLLVLGNAVSDLFSPSPAPDQTKPGDRIDLLCVGSLDPRKNLSRLVRVWLDLKAAGRLPEQAVLNLVGGANPRNFADFDRAEDVSIRWHGRVSDQELVRHYQRADAFIFPSLYEGFGLPPLEAMACGTPVLLSRAASLPEVGGDQFQPGDPASRGAVSYFDPLSEAEIGDAILRFLALDPGRKRRLRDNALARAAEFSWDRIAEKIAEAIR